MEENRNYSKLIEYLIIIIILIHIGSLDFVTFSFVYRLFYCLFVLFVVAVIDKASAVTWPAVRATEEDQNPMYKLQVNQLTIGPSTDEFTVVEVHLKISLSRHFAL
jgi:hypothetical protein